MIEVGRLCVKTSGRDSMKKCVVVDQLDKGRVLIDGETRRRPCNPAHLEPLSQVLNISKGASHADVKAAMKELGIEMKDTKPKKTGPRPTQLRAKERKAALAKEIKPKKEKKAEPAKEEAKPAEAPKVETPAEKKE